MLVMTWKKLIILSNFCFCKLIAAQDTSAVLFPSQENSSSLDLENKIQSTLFTDVTKNLPPTNPDQSFLPSEYYLSTYRTPIHHRRDNIPYTFEYPNYPVYPVPHAEHSIGYTSKHLVIASFIGLLLLFAIIQNTIIAAKRKDGLIDVLPSRKKRDLYTSHNFTYVVEDILNNDAKIRCIQRTICLQNQRLYRDLGDAGKILAKYLTQGIEKSLDSSSGWNRLVKDAGRAGIRGENCNVLYRDCNISVIPKMYKKKFNDVRVNSKNKMRKVK